MIATPSIISNTGVPGVPGVPALLGVPGSNYEVSTGTLSGTLLMNSSPTGVGVTFNPSVVFSGSTLPVNNTGSGITNMMNALKDAYSGSSLSSNSTIGSLQAAATTDLAVL